MQRLGNVPLNLFGKAARSLSAGGPEGGNTRYVICRKENNVPKIGNIAIEGIYAEDLGGNNLCATAVLDVEEDGHKSVYFATIAENWNNELCVRRIPFGALPGENADYAPWDIVPNDIKKAIVKSSIDKKILQIYKEGFCAGNVDGPECSHKLPWMKDEMYEYHDIENPKEYENRLYRTVFSYIDRDTKYIFGRPYFGYTDSTIRYICQEDIYRTRDEKNVTPSPETRWNDNVSKELYLLNKTKTRIYHISEGDGSNLLPEDEANAYQDYWISEIFDLTVEGDRWKKEIDGGQWLETEIISRIDYTIEGVIERMMECDLDGDRKDWEIISSEYAEDLLDGDVQSGTKS